MLGQAGQQSGAQGVHISGPSGLQAAWGPSRRLESKHIAFNRWCTLANLELAVVATVTWSGIRHSTQAGSMTVGDVSTSLVLHLSAMSVSTSQAGMQAPGRMLSVQDGPEYS